MRESYVMHLGLNRFIVGAVLMVGFLVAEGSAKENQRQEKAKQILKTVEALTDIRAAGSAPFRLRERIFVAPLNPVGRANWSFDLAWFSPTEWREEVASPDFRQVRIASHGKLWTTRSAPTEPLRVFDIE